MKRGFTLLEMMTVMFIMFLLISMGTIALKGIVRGGGISGAVTVVKSVLSQARQTAIMQRKDVYVFFRTDADDKNGISTYMPYGKCTSLNNGTKLTAMEDFAWPADTMTGSRIFNLDASVRSGDPVYGTVATNITQKTVRLASVPSGTWGTGDDLGAELHRERFLPDGMRFGTAPDIVIFKANGSVQDWGGLQIELTEKHRDGGGSTTLSIDPLTGWIEEQGG